MGWFTRDSSPATPPAVSQDEAGRFFDEQERQQKETARLQELQRKQVEEYARHVESARQMLTLSEQNQERWRALLERWERLTDRAERMIERLEHDPG